MQEIAAWDFNAAALLKNVLKTPFDVKRLCRDPEATARSFGFSLSKQMATEFAALDVLADLPDAKDEVDEEVRDFFYKIAADGHYVSEWHIAPAEVAQKLGIDISPEAIFRIGQINGPLTTDQRPDRPRPTPIVVGIVALAIGVAILIGAPVFAARMDKHSSPVFQPGNIDRL